MIHIFINGATSIMLVFFFANMLWAFPGEGDSNFFEKGKYWIFIGNALMVANVYLYKKYSGFPTKK